jgi:hypothetical protein
MRNCFQQFIKRPESRRNGWSHPDLLHRAEARVLMRRVRSELGIAYEALLSCIDAGGHAQ